MQTTPDNRAHSALERGFFPLQVRTKFRADYESLFPTYYWRIVFPHVDLTNDFLYEIEERHKRGQIAVIMIYAPNRGVGKSIAGLKLMYLFEGPQAPIKDRVTSSKSSMIVVLQNILKREDVCRAILEEFKSGTKETTFDSILSCYLARVGKTLRDGGRITVDRSEFGVVKYYEGLTEEELREQFQTILDDLCREGKIKLENGKVRLLNSNLIPRRRCVIQDETNEAHMAGARTQSDRLENLIDILRVLNIDYINIGLSVPTNAIKFDYLLKPEIPYFDSVEKHKLKLVWCKLYCKTDQIGKAVFIWVGWVRIDSPPEDFISQYIQAEKTPNVISTLATGGLVGLDAQFALNDSTEKLSEKYDVDHLVAEVENDPYFSKVKFKKEVRALLHKKHGDIDLEDEEACITLLGFKHGDRDRDDERICVKEGCTHHINRPLFTAKAGI